MSNLAQRITGKFIVLDGPDGSGKSTQMILLRDRLAELGAAVESVYEPGATELGEKVRQILLGRDTARIGAMAETLLFMASRAQLVEEKIKPALKAGKVVLCDRFVSATLAYQGASGVDVNTILDLAEAAVQGIWPDLTVILDVSVEVGMQRAGAPRDRVKTDKNAKDQLALFGDRLEARSDAYHQAVRKNFRNLVKDYPHPCLLVSADKEPPAVLENILSAIEKTFPDR
jgi:dTMP kinase